MASACEVCVVEAEPEAEDVVVAMKSMAKTLCPFPLRPSPAAAGAALLASLPRTHGPTPAPKHLRLDLVDQTVPARIVRTSR